MDTITNTIYERQTVALNNPLQGILEGKIHLFKKPAAGAARIWILYRFPFEILQIFRKGDL